MTQYVAQRKINEGTYPSLAVLVEGHLRRRSQSYGSLAKVPADAVGNTRNDMYLASEAIRFLMKDKENDLTQGRGRDLERLQGARSTARPSSSRLWVKVAVAIALGLGTMIGWKRIVITVGEKIGKTHLTYAPGRLGRTGRRRHDRRRRRVRPAGLDHARAVVGRRRHDGGQRLGPADGDGPQPADGLGADAAGRDPAAATPAPSLNPVLSIGGAAGLRDETG